MGKMMETTFPPLLYCSGGKSIRSKIRDIPILDRPCYTML